VAVTPVLLGFDLIELELGERDLVDARDADRFCGSL
jgi:hypothetical protein